MSPGESVISPTQVSVSPGYFEAMGAKLAGGRFFSDRDRAAAPKVVIVDQTLANRFWHGQDPVGRRMYMPTDINNLLAINERTVFRNVVGVIHDVKLEDLTEGTRSVGTYYFPLAQDTSGLVTFALKTPGDPTALSGVVREAINGLDREMPIFDMQTMEQRTEKSLMTRRSPVLLSLSFGAIALFLSAIGIYGGLAYLVTQRQRGSGIRAALGRTAGGVVRLVVGEALWLLGVGVLLGVAGSAAAVSVVAGHVLGAKALDPLGE